MAAQLPPFFDCRCRILQLASVCVKPTATSAIIHRRSTNLTSPQVGNAERILYPLANLMVFGLSVNWALPVVRGTLRRLFGTEEQLAMAAETAAAAVANETAAAVAGRGEKESGEFDAPSSSARLYQRHTSLIKSSQ